LLSSQFNPLATLSVPGNNIPIEQLFCISGNTIIVGTTIGMFLGDFNTHKLVLLDKQIILKDIAISEDSAFLATTRSLLSIPLDKLLKYHKLSDTSLHFTILKNGRARTIATGIKNGKPYILCSFIDGTYQWQNDHMERFSYNGQQIYASIIRSWLNKIIIGTFNQGIFVVDNGKIRNITTRDGLLSNNIKGIKLYGDGMWIISFSGLIQKMNDQLDFVKTPQVPFNSALIQDIEEMDKKIYIATNPELYSIEYVAKDDQPINTFIDYVLINGKDTVCDNYVFSSDENNLQLNLSAPFFNSVYSLRFKYRFYNINNATMNWQVSEGEQRTFTLLGLRPGKYVFEAVAINPMGQTVAKQINQIIEIKPAWYQTLWFRIGFFVLVGLLVFCISRMLLLYSLRKKQAELEKRLAIQNERQRISSDLHDDIGSTLSSINIYAELAKDADNKSFYLDSIGKNIRDVVGKLDDLVWSISPRHETWESVAEKIKDYAEPIVALKEITLTIGIGEFLKKTKPAPEIKHHVYMIAKELINNSIKHSGCTKIEIQFEYNKGMLILVASDNGKGFEKDWIRQNRNGLWNITTRVKEMNGSIDKGSATTSGAMIKVQIPL
jgi:signal transduction histidine kinase